MKRDEEQTPAPPFGLIKARRLIDHGLGLWEENDHPRRRSVIWPDGRYEFRLTRSSFRVLLDWRWTRRGDAWKPGYCRWN